MSRSETRIGVARERKIGERRVALTPAGTHQLVSDGHAVFVEREAGVGSGYPDADYLAQGAEIVEQEEVWSKSELLLKVKEPIASEYEFVREGLVLFTYLHLAAAPRLADALLAAGTRALAYETIEDDDGGLPLLAPMSEIAGRLSAQAGAYFLQASEQGCGVLIGGAPGVAPARVLVIGGGAVGVNAARVAAGMGASVTVLERDPKRIRQLDDLFDGRVQVLMSDALRLQEEVVRADLIIGAVLIPGALAPRLISRDLLATMRPGAVIVDVAIDQGGCVETARPTTHEDPAYVIDGIVHYCVANMPGAVPVTSTRALTNATLPYVRSIAGHGLDEAMKADRGFATGLNIDRGRFVNKVVADAYRHQR